MEFKVFISKEEREAKKQLKIIEQLLSTNGWKVKEYLGDDDPYVFVFNPKKDTFFDGVRIYKVGDQIAFKVQKEEKTHPFGTAYPLAIEDMFFDLISEYKPEEAGRKIIEAVIREMTKFFEKSAEAEKEVRDQEFQRDPFGKAVIRAQDFGIDYANLSYSR